MGEGRPSAGRDRLVEVAGREFARSGYSGVGVSSLLEAAEVPSGVLYHHFGSKERLACAAIESVGEAVLQSFDDAMSSDVPLAEAVRRVIEAWRRRLEASDYTVGCPIATTALEMAGTSSALRTAAADQYGRWIQRLVDALVADRWDLDAAHRAATAVVALVEGALLLSKTFASSHPMEAALATVDVMFSSPS